MMGKRFKLRIPSFSFHCYRSRDIISSPPSPSQPSKSHHSSLTRHVSSVFKTIGCGCRSKSTNVFSPPSPPPPEKNKKKMKKRRLKKKKSPSLRFRISTSSTESGIFSSESFNEEEGEEVETETLVSSSKSISFSSGSDDSSHLETIRENPYKIKKKKKKKKKKVRRMKKSPTSPEEEEEEEETESPARLSVFQRLIPCTVDGKVRESYAVVKKSEDPYEDFKRSMMEMIMEKQIFDEKDLEQLLHCLLSLNQKEHHAVIVEAFSEIWKSIFSTTIH